MTPRRPESQQSSTSNWAQVARDAGATVEAMEGFAQAITLLNQGRIDATVNDSIAEYACLAELKFCELQENGAIGDG